MVLEAALRWLGSGEGSGWKRTESGEGALQGTLGGVGVSGARSFACISSRSLSFECDKHIMNLEIQPTSPPSGGCAGGRPCRGSDRNWFMTQLRLAKKITGKQTYRTAVKLLLKQKQYKPQVDIRTNTQF